MKVSNNYWGFSWIHRRKVMLRMVVAITGFWITFDIVTNLPRFTFSQWFILGVLAMILYVCGMAHGRTNLIKEATNHMENTR